MDSQLQRRARALDPMAILGTAMAILAVLTFLFVRTPLFPIDLGSRPVQPASSKEASPTGPAPFVAVESVAPSSAAPRQDGPSSTQRPSVPNVSLVGQRNQFQIEANGLSCSSAPFWNDPPGVRVIDCVRFLVPGDHPTSLQFTLTDEQYNVWGSAAAYGVAWWTDYSSSTFFDVTFPDGSHCRNKSFQIYPGTFSVTIYPGSNRVQAVAQGQITPDSQKEHNGLPYCVPSVAVARPDR